MYIKNSDSHHVEVLSAAVSLALNSIAYYMHVYVEDAEKLTRVKPSMEAMQLSLKDWVSSVVGSKMFGGEVTWRGKPAPRRSYIEINVIYTCVSLYNICVLFYIVDLEAVSFSKMLQY